jgi:hypothetical protein
MKFLSMPEAKMAWGFILLLGILTLCARIALGHVEQGTSYGLTEIIGILAVLAGQWANWAFGESRSSSGSTTEQKHQGDVA